MKRTPSIARLGLVGFGLGVASVLSLSIRTYVSGGRYRPYRYSDVGGPFLAAIGMAVAFACGLILGAGIATRLSAEPGERSGVWPWYVDVVPALVLLYLIVAANLGR